MKATNKSAEKCYDILVDATVTYGRVDSITYSFENINGTKSSVEEALILMEEGLGDVDGDGDTLDARYIIKAGEAYRIVVTVDSPDDASPGELEVELKFRRAP